jgi:hypothetical protein
MEITDCIYITFVVNTTSKTRDKSKRFREGIFFYGAKKTQRQNFKIK